MLEKKSEGWFVLRPGTKIPNRKTFATIRCDHGLAWTKHENYHFYFDNQINNDDLEEKLKKKIRIFLFQKKQYKIFPHPCFEVRLTKK